MAKWFKSKCRQNLTIRGPFIFMLSLTLLVLPEIGFAGRCSISKSRNTAIPKFLPAKKPERSVYRQPSPIITHGAKNLTTTHFRIFWGENYNPPDPDWDDPDNDQIPTWIEVLADSFGNAYTIQVNLGFSTPYGVMAFA